jgi:hypothetical protein
LWWRWVLAVVGGELIGFAVPTVVGGVLTGVVVGAITGAVLVWLLPIGASSAKQFSSTDWTGLAD